MNASPPGVSERRDQTVVVIVPAFNEAATIEDTVRSLLRQTRLPDQVLVVDDFSRDDTGPLATRCAATVIRTPTNTGTKAQAQNAALPYAHARRRDGGFEPADIVLTVDADTILAPDALEKILAAFADPAVVAACGFVLPQRVRTSWERGRFIEYLFGLTFYKSIQNRAGAVVVCSGCFSAFRLATLQRYGGFKRRTWAEDMDLTWELHAHGEKVVYVPEAVCYPLDPPTWRVYRQQVNRWAVAFYQNVRLHRKALRGRPLLQMLVAVALLDILVAPLYVAGLFLSAYYWGARGVGTLVGIDALLMAGPLLLGAVRRHRVRDALLSFPFVYVNRVANLWISWQALIRVWVLGDTGKVWEKGH